MPVSVIVIYLLDLPSPLMILQIQGKFLIICVRFKAHYAFYLGFVFLLFVIYGQGKSGIVFMSI
jgi:hypothetical protein